MKRTLKNCTIARKYGVSEQKNGRCIGVGQYGDEPFEPCQECKLCESYETQEIRTCHFCKKEVDNITSVFAYIKTGNGALKQIDYCRECWDEAVKECRKK